VSSYLSGALQGAFTVWLALVCLVGGFAVVSRRRPRPGWHREVLFVSGFYGLYSGLRLLSPQHNWALPIANAHRLLGWERFLHLDIEAGFNRWFMSLPADIPRLAQDWYAQAHLWGTLGVLVWLWRYRPERYSHWRNVLGLTSLVALLGYAFWPASPPWIAIPGMVGGLSGVDLHLAVLNAAMPSLHSAWADWVGLAMFSACRRPLARALWVLYPVWTAVVIIGTANHYVLDAVCGLALLAAAHISVERLERAVSARRRSAAVTGAGTEEAAAVPREPARRAA
jgi:hypothetical protein